MLRARKIFLKIKPCTKFIVSFQTMLAMKTHLTGALMCLQMWGFPCYSTFEYSRREPVLLLVSGCLPLQPVAMVVGCTGRTDSPHHTTPSEHQYELEWTHSQERVFSLLSAAMYPVFSVVFLLDTHPQSWSLIKVLSLLHRVGLFLMSGFLLVSV